MPAVFIEDGVPAVAIVRRFDQRKSEVPQRALVIGQSGEGYGAPSMRCGLLTDPGVDVVGDDGGSEPPEIADAGAAGSIGKATAAKAGLPATATEDRGARSPAPSAAPHPPAPAIFRRRTSARLGILDARCRAARCGRPEG